MDGWCYWEMIQYYAKIYNIPTTGEEGFDKLICLFFFFYLSASASQVLPHSRALFDSCIEGGATHKPSLIRVFKGQKAIEEERHLPVSQTVSHSSLVEEVPVGSLIHIFVCVFGICGTQKSIQEVPFSLWNPDLIEVSTWTLPVP